jgi:hypothetical protein
MENMVQMTLEEYNEFLKSKLDFCKKRDEYDFLCKNNGEVVIECNYEFAIFPIYNVICYKGKDETIKHLSEQFNDQDKLIKEMNEKWKLLLKLTDKKSSTFTERLKFLFTGYISNVYNRKDDNVF